MLVGAAVTLALLALVGIGYGLLRWWVPNPGFLPSVGAGVAALMLAAWIFSAIYGVP